jgi:hypothetical protein
MENVIEKYEKLMNSCEMSMCYEDAEAHYAEGEQYCNSLSTDPVEVDICMKDVNATVEMMRDECDIRECYNY